MKTLAKYHVCNHCIIGVKTFTDILIGPGTLPGLSRNGPQESCHKYANYDHPGECSPEKNCLR